MYVLYSNHLHVLCTCRRRENLVALRLAGVQGTSSPVHLTLRPLLPGPPGPPPVEGSGWLTVAESAASFLPRRFHESSIGDLVELSKVQRCSLPMTCRAMPAFLAL